MSQVVLGLGGNIGNVLDTFKEAVVQIEKGIGELKLKSSIYATKPWGVEDQPDFLNVVILLETDQLPNEVLINCLSIEKRLGRKRIGLSKWNKRLIDIDVLFYDDQVVDSDSLKVPHPLIQDRNFVLHPLAEILPDLRHPILNKTAQELKNETLDKSSVTLIENKNL